MKATPWEVLVVRKSLALFAIVIPLVLAACGGDDDSSSTSASSDTESSTTVSAGGSGDTLDFSETEFKIDPADPTAKAGNVTFNVTNDGQTVHNLEVEGNGVEEVTDDLQPGDNGVLSVDLQPGTYEIYCSIDSHREQGMEGELTVQ
jgi:uncharacterized cupredoxin-like copper-binding protein